MSAFPGDPQRASRWRGEGGGWLDADLRHHWHPCSQMKDYEAFPALPVVGAAGAHIHLADGTRLFDACSSWWCKALGHGHPRLRAALIAQAERYEHVIAAQTAQGPSARLAEKLAAFMPKLPHVFFGGDGSTAVEIAAKMALHAQSILGRPERTHFAALRNGYHGESGISLGLSDLGLYREPYAAALPMPTFLGPLPYVQSPAARAETFADAWAAIEAQLDAIAGRLAAIAFEPVLQGAGGMRVYDPELLRRLRRWSSENGVLLIADEILTGFYRTGPRLACEWAGITPDLICLSKGLTAGWLPLSATLVHQDLYRLFYHDYGQGRDFLHSNTYAGNALGCSVALEALQVYADEDIPGRIASTAPRMHELFREMAEATGVLGDVRVAGMVVAADLKPEALARFDASRPSSSQTPPRAGLAVYREAVHRGALWRNLGSTLYWLPPLTSEIADLRQLRDIGIASLRAVFGLSAPMGLSG